MVLWIQACSARHNILGSRSRKGGREPGVRRIAYLGFGEHSRHRIKYIIAKQICWATSCNNYPVSLLLIFCKYLSAPERRGVIRRKGETGKDRFGWCKISALWGRIKGWVFMTGGSSWNGGSNGFYQPLGRWDMHETESGIFYFDPWRWVVIRRVYAC